MLTIEYPSTFKKDFKHNQHKTSTRRMRRHTAGFFVQKICQVACQLTFAISGCVIL